MAEEPNQVEADRGSEDAERIKQDIERTRASMSGTIDEIQERLNPQNIVQQAKDSVRGAAVGKVKGALNTASKAASRAADQAQTTATRVASQTQVGARRAVSQARENPVPAALIASGLLWAMSRGMGSRRDRYRSYDSRWSRRDSGDYDSDSYGSSLMGNRQAQGAFIAGVLGYYLMSRRSAAMRGTGSSEFGSSEYGSTGMNQSTTDRLRRALAEPARNVGESARRVGESAKRAGRTAQEKAREYAGRSKDVGQHVGRWVGENPLAVGAAVVALGTVVGLSMANDDFLYDDDDDWSRMNRRSNDLMGHEDDFGRGAESDYDRPDGDVGPKPGRSGRTSRM